MKKFNFIKETNPHKYICLILNLILGIIVIIMMLFKCQDVTNVFIIVSDNKIKGYIPYQELIEITENNKIIIDHKIYEYKINQIDEMTVIGIQNYQIVELDIKNNHFLNNMSISGKIIKNNIKLYQKIILEIIERNDNEAIK